MLQAVESLFSVKTGETELFIKLFKLAQLAKFISKVFIGKNSIFTTTRL